MAGSEKDECLDAVIPQDAVEINITNIVNPYFIQIVRVRNDATIKNNLNCILNKLYNNLRWQTDNHDYIPAVEDNVIVNAQHTNDVELPAWKCRGLVTSVGTKSSNVFLLDHGIIINTPNNSLIKYSEDAIALEPLSESIGIYNILPMNFWESTKWTKETTDFVKNLIESSEKIYFNPLAYNKSTNKQYGDLYLMIENKNICLSKVLIYNNMAVHLCNELLQVIMGDNIVDKILVPYNLGKCPSKQIKLVNKEYNFRGSTKITNLNKREVKEKILIKSKYEVQKLEHLASSKFTTFVHKSLQNQGLRNLKEIESHMWPALKEGLNIVTISSGGSGKTIGYTVPIANSVGANEEIFLEKKQKSDIVTKPVVLILCASIRECIDVTSNFNDILMYHKTIRSFAAFNGISDAKLLTEICNKFHILVSTPPFLLRLLKKYSNKLNVSELSYLVLDHADILLDKYMVELMTLIREFKIINKDWKNSIQGGSMQIVAVSETWTEKICSFINNFIEDPYICIGSFTEAAAFCRVQARMLIRHSDQKKNEILVVLSDYLKVKTMIFCVDAKEAIDLNNFLLSHSVKTMLVHEEMDITRSTEMKEEWVKYLCGTYPVIICTDEILSEMEIVDIEFLIHYSITETSKTQFNRRFSVLMDNFKEQKSRCKILILFDETKENAHFKGVVNILKRLNVELPEDWDKLADGLELKNNFKKKNYPICDNIKLFGVCATNSCPYRHRVIAEVDKPKTDISIGDELKLIVTYRHNASHISARIIEYLRKSDVTGKIESIPCQYPIIPFTMKIRDYYSNSKNRRMINNIEVGLICVIRSRENNFVRVQILNIVKKEDISDKPKYVKLRCIDSGQIIDQLHVNELFEISNEILQYKFPVVDIFITGCFPMDEEQGWTEFANKEAGFWFEKNLQGSSFVFAKVLLHIGQCVWTDTLVIRSKLIGYPDLVSQSLKNVLIDKEHSMENKAHIRNLLSLCINGGITDVNGHPLDLILNEHEENVAANSLSKNKNKG